MNILSAISVVMLTALIHASFQLSVSVVTTLSSYARGRKSPRGKLFRLTSSFLGGTITMTLLIVSFIGYLASGFHKLLPVPQLWTIVSGALIGIGVVVWLAYYRRGDGTNLWIPRSFSRFLQQRATRTSLAAEAYSLGLVSVVAELVFIIAPATAAAITIAALPFHWQIAAIALYTAIASLSISLVTALIGSGHSLSSIQRWREHNKRFLQFAAGAGLIVLGFYLYTSQVTDIAARMVNL